MYWWILLATVLFGVGAWAVLPAILVALGVRFARRRMLGDGGSSRRPLLGSSSRSGDLVPAGARKGCPAKEKEALRRMERRLVSAHQQCLAAIDTKLPSELARARVTPPLEDAYAQIGQEIASIYAFCDRNDLVGTLRKANSSSSAKDIYLQAYQRDLAKVREAIAKTEECLAAYERTVATLEVSSVEADISSDFDASIEMLRDLRDELPRYNLEDRV